MVLESLGLPMFQDISTLAEVTRLTEKLLYFLSKENAEGRYVSFKIKKKDGNLREINAPCASLKIMQRWILQNILYKVRVSQYSIGFIKNGKGSPLVLCAERHKNNLYILKMDLKDFYPSICRAKVYNQFLQLGYNTYAANLITNICILDGKLPQGAVTSPYLASLVCYKMDVRIAAYCNKRDIVYTRYADDLTFSCDNRDELHKIYGMIKKIVEDEGFTLNQKKTQFLTPKGHKKVVGVTINDGMLKASKDLKRSVRAMIHYQIITGDYTKNEQIRGYIAYIDSIEKNYKKKIIKYVTGYCQDTITLFSDAVKAFNANKLFKEIPDMVQKDISSFPKWEDQSDYMEMVMYERESYLAKHGLIESDIEDESNLEMFE